MLIDHIGIVIPKIKNVGTMYHNLLGFIPVTEIVLDSAQQVYVQFFQNEEGLRLELIEPIGKESPAYNALKKGGGTNHVGYRCSNIDDTLAEARKHNCIIVCQPIPGVGHEGRLIAFVTHPHLGLIEFVEYNNGG